MERKDQLRLFLDPGRRVPDLPQKVVAAVRKDIADLLLQVVENREPEKASEVNKEEFDESLR